MTPLASVKFDDDRRDYAPGDSLSGRLEVTTMPHADAVVVKAEFSVLWYTEGKGDQDIGVVHLERLWENRSQPAGEHHFSVRLPLLPLDLRPGQDVLVDEPFNVLAGD